MVKIIIIGAGISGLSTYLFLLKHLQPDTPSATAHEIKIYEAYDIHASKFNATLAGAANGERVMAAPTNETEPLFTPQAIGSAIGLSKNGLSVLSRLDEHGSDKTSGGAGLSIMRQMAVHGHPIDRWEISTARGFTIANAKLDGPKGHKAGSKKSTSGAQAPEKKDDLYHAIMIARQACWDILRDRVVAVSPDAVVRKKVVDVIIGDGKARNVVKFEDGGQEEADLVIGADGLRSVLRKAMFRDQASDTPQDPAQSEATASWARTLRSYLTFTRPRAAESKKMDFISPHYEGLVGVGGFVPSSVLQSTGQTPGAMSIVFGPNGFFGYGYLTSAPPHDPPRSSQKNDATATSAGQASETSSPDASAPAPGPLAGWWSTFSSPTPYPYSLTGPADGTSAPKPTAFDKPLALHGLLTRHASWHNPSIAAILSYVKSDTATHGSDGKGLDASYPTWTTPELPTWHANGRAVLVGDAAHALQPSSGQGACQALEDAEALALFLRHYLAQPSSAASLSPAQCTTPLLSSAADARVHARLHRALRAYQALRSPRVHKIHVRSQKMSNLKSDMNIVTEYTVYFVIWMMTWRWLNWCLMRLGLNDLERENEELFGYDLPGEVERFLATEKKRGAAEQGRDLHEESVTLDTI